MCVRGVILQRPLVIAANLPMPTILVRSWSRPTLLIVRFIKINSRTCMRFPISFLAILGILAWWNILIRAYWRLVLLSTTRIIPVGTWSWVVLLKLIIWPQWRWNWTRFKMIWKNRPMSSKLLLCVCYPWPGHLHANAVLVVTSSSSKLVLLLAAIARDKMLITLRPWEPTSAVKFCWFVGKIWSKIGQNLPQNSYENLRTFSNKFSETFGEFFPKNQQNFTALVGSQTAI